MNLLQDDLPDMNDNFTKIFEDVPFGDTLHEPLHLLGCFEITV